MKQHVSRYGSTTEKRYFKSFKSRNEACQFAKEMQEKVDKGRSNKPKRITLAEFNEEHERLMKDQLAYKTWLDHKHVLRIFAKHVGEQALLEKVNPSDAEFFVSKRRAEGVAIATVLWGHANTSGGRKNELLNLTWADIDFANESVSFVPKKASKLILEWTPKGRKSRIAPIPPETIQLLANLQADADSSPYVFVREKRLWRILKLRAEGAWKPHSELVNNILRQLKKFCQQAKVVEFNFHDLRRSCTINWSKGLTIQTVQELAGHSKIETTRKYYLSLHESDFCLARKLRSNLMTSLTNY